MVLRFGSTGAPPADGSTPRWIGQVSLSMNVTETPIADTMAYLEFVTTSMYLVRHMP